MESPDWWVDRLLQINRQANRIESELYDPKFRRDEEDAPDTQHVDPANPWRNTHPSTLKKMAGVSDDTPDAAIDFLYDR